MTSTNLFISPKKLLHRVTVLDKDKLMQATQVTCTRQMHPMILKCVLKILKPSKCEVSCNI